MGLLECWDSITPVYFSRANGLLISHIKPALAVIPAGQLLAMRPSPR